MRIPRPASPGCRPLFRVLVLLSILTATAPPLAAAEPALVGIIALTADPDVAEQLELEPSQRNRLRQLIISREDAGLSLALDVKDLPPEERDEKLAPFRRESERLGMQILTFRQRTRLRRIHLQRMGVAAIAEPGMAASLNLSDEQREELTALIAERAAALHSAPTADLPRVEEEYRKRVLGVLADSQREAFESVLGGAGPLPADESDNAIDEAPVEVAASDPVAPESAAVGPAGAADSSRPQTGANPADDRQTAAITAEATPNDQDPAQPPDADSVPDPETADSGRASRQAAEPEAIAAAKDAATQSSGDAGTEPSRDPAAEGNSPTSPSAATQLSAATGPLAADSLEVPAAAPTSAPAGDGLLRFNFHYAPWQDVIEWFAEQNDLALQMDASPPGTFNFTDPRSYTPQDALDLINRILLAKGFTLVRQDKMLFVLRVEDGIPPNLIRAVSPADLDELGESELVSTVFPLSTITTAEAKAEIEPLLRSQGSIVELPRSRRIQVTETAGRLRLIRSILEAIESPAAAFGELEQIDLAHRLADEVLPVIREMFAMPDDSNALPDESLRVTVGLDGGQLLARGTPERIARLREIVELVDQPGPPGSAYGTIQTPQLEVYSIAGADPAAVLRVLQTILAGDPDARLEVDAQTGNLYALARPAQHATIRATIAQAEQDARQIDVIPLTTVDPQVAVLAVNKLFGAAGDAGNANAPTVDADPTTRSLLVRGTESQLAQVRSLLEKLGENTSARVAGASRGNVRLLPLGGRDATSALYQIEQIWPTLRPNRIRIVSPSSRVGIPAYRPSDPASSTSAPPWQVRPSQNPSLENFPPDREPEGGPPQAQGSRETEPTDDTAAATGRGRIRFAMQTQTTERSPDEQAAPTQSRPTPPILVAPGPGGLLIASEDTAALDELESLLAAVTARASASGREFAVYYLRYARASVVAQTLTEVFGGDSGGGGGSGLIGDLAGAALGEAGGLVTGLLGMSGSGGSILGGSVDIVPDDRLNVLVVEAKPADLDTVEQLLRILDQPTSPEEVQVDAPPRLIPVYNTSASQIATVVQQVYQDRMRSAPGQQQQPSPEDIIRLLRGGRGEGGQNRDQQEAAKMSIGIDTRSNSLVVRAPDPLFEEVKRLVETLDNAEVAKEEATRVISVRSANSTTVQRALAALYGGSIQTSIPPQATQADDGAPAAGPRGRPGQRQPDEAARREFFEGIRRFQQFQQQFQQQPEGDGASRGRRGGRP